MPKCMIFLCLVSLVCGLSGCATQTEPTTQIFQPQLTVTSPDATVPVEEEEEIKVDVLAHRKQLAPDSASASSTFEDGGEETFPPGATLDGDIDTGWVEGGEGFGRGEWLQHNFAWPEAVQEVWFFNGHGEKNQGYAQIQEITLSFSSGHEWSYAVTEGWNTIVLPQVVDTTYVRLSIINSNTKGGENSCISEIKVFNASGDEPTEGLSRDSIFESMGALGDCSNITPEQAAAFAAELQRIMDWAEETSLERASTYGQDYGAYTGEALLFSGGDGIPVLYYDYDFLKVEELFITETDVIVWDGITATSRVFETAGKNTNINWILPGYVYENQGEYHFGLTEYDMYGSGSFGLIAMVPFSGGLPESVASYVAFISHQSQGAYTYQAEMQDYLKMPFLSSFPTHQLVDLATPEVEAYYEFNGTNFQDKELAWSEEDMGTWFSAIRLARVNAGYQQMAAQPGDVVMAGLLALASGQYSDVR